MQHEVAVGRITVEDFKIWCETSPNETSYKVYERILPLTVPPHTFVGKKPIAVLFGEERVEVKTWKNVYEVVLKRCNEDPQNHEMLLYLCGKVNGNHRVLLASSPEKITRPVKIDEGIYGETYFGSQGLMHVLLNRILAPIGFRCYDIRVVLRS
jgi:hypothetical protein